MGGGRPRPRPQCLRWGFSSPPKGAQPPIFVSCLLWQNGWTDQDATWYAGRPRPRRQFAVWGPSSPPTKKGHSSPLFGPCLLWPNGRPSQQLLSSCLTILCCVNCRRQPNPCKTYQTTHYAIITKLRI